MDRGDGDTLGHRFEWSVGVQKLPFWMKSFFSGFVFLLAHSTCKYLSPADLLSLCSLAVLTTLAAIWLESPLLAGMAASAVVLDFGWTIGAAAQLLSGQALFSFNAHVFDDAIPLSVRLLFAYHAWLPALQLWLVHRLKYDAQAWATQTMVAWSALLACYYTTSPLENINWVFEPGRLQTSVPGELYLFAWLGVLAVGIYLPTHFALKWTMPQAALPPSTDAASALDAN